MADTHSIRSAAYWTEERIREAAKPYKSITEFAKGNNRAYKRALRSGLVHTLFETKSRAPYTEQDVIEAAKKYKNRRNLHLNNPSLYGAALRLGVIDKYFVCKNRKWTLDDAIEAAGRFDSKTELKKSKYQAYALLLEAGLIDSLFENKLKTWDFESVEIEAKKYKTRSDFAKYSGSAYIWALRNQIIEKLIPDVVDGHNTRDCVYIWAADEVSGIYKVGVTSSNRGHDRIEKVARKAGFSDSARVVAYRSVGSEAALRVESKLKKIGTPYRFDRRFDGCTEFRRMKPDELSKAVQIINEH